MKIYLDIDDTLITNYISGVYLKTKPANHLKEFLEYMIKNHDVYWLTTHCNGDADTAVSYLGQFVGKDIVDMIKKIKPTKWTHLKTEAVNMDEDFLWFDDQLSFDEEKQLREKGKLESFVRVNLELDPDILREFVDRPVACRGYVVDIFKKSYMLHIWTWPKFKAGWHRKIDGPNKRIFSIRKY
jgi:hypothetical protein